jgi:hypothetical protein
LAAPTRELAEFEREELIGLGLFFVEINRGPDQGEAAPA